VIDTSALVEVLTTDPAAIPELARRVHGVEWMSAPSLVDYEVLNVLRKLVLRQSIDIELAEDSRRTLRALRLVRYPMRTSLPTACGSSGTMPRPTTPRSSRWRNTSTCRW
jgi:predicted nucleic acid-binding protein